MDSRDLETAPLLNSSVYNNYPAPTSRTRGCWNYGYAALFLLSLTLVFGVGVLSLMHRSPQFDVVLDPRAMQNPGSCPVNAARETLSGTQGDSLLRFLELSSYGVAPSMLCALMLGLFFLFLSIASPSYFVQLNVWVELLVPAACAIIAFVTGHTRSAQWYVALTFLLVVVAIWRRNLGLVTQLMTLSKPVATAIPCIVAVGLLYVVMVFAISLSGIAAYSNGTLKINPQRDPAVQDTCVDPLGSAVPCCVWSLPPWVPPYLLLCWLVFGWITVVASNIKVFTVARTFRTWHYSSSSHTATPACAWSALGVALSSFFGCMCASATLLVTVFLGVTGESMSTASRDLKAVLLRNNLDENLWWPPVFLIKCSAAVCALAWSYVLEIPIPLLSNPLPTLDTASAFAFYFLLDLIITVPLDALYTAYVCFALDRDHSVCENPGVHELLARLPEMPAPVVHSAVPTVFEPDLPPRLGLSPGRATLDDVMQAR